MSTEDEELETLTSPWARYTWTMLLGLTWLGCLYGYLNVDIPGYRRDSWLLLGMGLTTATALIYLSPFTWILGTRKVMLGDAALMTLNEDAYYYGSIPWLDEDENPILTMGKAVNGAEIMMEVKFAKRRCGGIPVLGIKGKDWGVFPDVPGGEVDNGPVKRIMWDMQPTPREALPEPIRSAFVMGGTVTQKGYNPKRSRIFFGLRPLVDVPMPKLHGRLDAAYRSANIQGEKMEYMIRQFRGLTQPEGKPVVVVREREERRGERDLVE